MRRLGPALLLLGAMGAIAAVASRLTPAPALPAAVSAHTNATPSATVADDRWPGPLATLSAPQLATPTGWTPRRVVLDPGHGAIDNSGNRSAFCLDEQDFTLRVAERLAQRWRSHGRFEVKLSRRGDTRVGYRKRVTAAQAWGAAAFISIHSDVRGAGKKWAPSPEQRCMRNDEHPGFSVLWSDHDDTPLNDRRLTLAEAVATQLTRLGLPAYDGRAYAGLYAARPGAPGVFVDRHQPKKRIFVLHAPTMASIIVETHHAWDPREAQRWAQDDTLDAFADALEAALLEVL